MAALPMALTWSSVPLAQSPKPTTDADAQAETSESTELGHHHDVHISPLDLSRVADRRPRRACRVGVFEVRDGRVVARDTRLHTLVYDSVDAFAVALSNPPPTVVRVRQPSERRTAPRLPLSIIAAFHASCGPSTSPCAAHLRLQRDRAAHQPQVHSKAQSPSCSERVYRLDLSSGGPNETRDRTDDDGGGFDSPRLDSRAGGSSAASGLRDRNRISSRYHDGHLYARLWLAVHPDGTGQVKGGAVLHVYLWCRQRTQLRWFRPRLGNPVALRSGSIYFLNSLMPASVSSNVAPL